MRISVIIPTYRRPKELERCLKALKEQTRQADEILVVVRDSDEETKIFLENIKSNYHGLRSIIVNVPGQVAALNAGLESAKGDIIAFTDDDAVPYLNWLELIKRHFQADPKVGGVGGRDNVFIKGKEISSHKSQVTSHKPSVGIITWYGRIVGNHHLGVGSPRSVDHLKGCNMSFYREAIRSFRFDKRLRGTGAQYRNELALCLEVKQRGWKLIYDPKAMMDHHYATRYDDDVREKFNATAVENSAHNEMFIILNYMQGGKRFVCLMYSLMISSTAMPGILQFIRIALMGRNNALSRFMAGMKGRVKGWRTWATISSS